MYESHKLPITKSIRRFVKQKNGGFVITKLRTLMWFWGNKAFCTQKAISFIDFIWIVIHFDVPMNFNINIDYQKPFPMVLCGWVWYLGSLLLRRLVGCILFHSLKIKIHEGLCIHHAINCTKSKIIKSHPFHTNTFLSR